jgi:chemotaxis protein methyltransferase CheR
MDLIFCRNVTIYFTEEATQRIVHNFHESLAPGGWLIVGHSEPSLVTYQAFETHTFPGTVLYRKAGELPPGGMPATSPQKNGAQPWPFDAGRALTPWPTIAAGDVEPTLPAEWPTKTAATTQSRKQPTASRPVDGAGLPPVATGHVVETAGATPGALDKAEWAKLVVAPGNLSEEMVALIEENQSQIPDPLKAPAYCQLARHYANSAEWQTAQRWCQETIAHDNLCAEAYFILGMVYDHQGHLDAAVAALRKVIYIDAEAPLAHFYLAMLYRRLGQAVLAQRALSNVIRILSRWTPEKVVPDSNERKAGELVEMCRRLLDAAPAGSKAG